MEESWSSVEQVAVHLRGVQNSISRWIEAQEFPEHKVGRFWKFKLSEVDEWGRAEWKESGKKRVLKIKTTKIKRRCS